MKARLLVHIYKKECCVGQELTEVEFGDLGELGRAIGYFSLNPGGGSLPSDKNPLGMLQSVRDFYRRQDRFKLAEKGPELRVMQVILLDEAR